MKTDVRITVAVDDTAGKRGTIAEHGFAVAIQTGTSSILFDTGQGICLTANCIKLKIPMDDFESVVLSHGHYDHAGGLCGVLRAVESQSLVAAGIGCSARTRVYAHPSAFLPKYVKHGDVAHSIGTTGLNECLVRAIGSELVWTEGPTEILSGVHVTGEIPRVTDFESTGNGFYTDSMCTTSDPILDDQAMFLDCAEGVVVLLGCAHSGVINTLRYVRELTGGKHIHSVIGGMHLLSASGSRLRKTADALAEMGVDHICPAHCTGLKATALLCSEFGEKCVPCRVGSTMEYSLD